MFDKLSIKWFYTLTISLFSLTVILNPGLIALDEYNHSVVHYIPAQTSTFANIVKESGLRSPLQVLPMYVIAQVVYKLGVTNTMMQHHLVIIVMGLLGLALMLYAIAILFPGGDFEAERKIAIMVLGLHCLAPFLLTRPMFESISAPWMLLAVAFAVRYDREHHFKDLAWAAVAVTMAFLLRPHAGFSALALVVLPLLANPRRISHFVYLGLLGLAAFVLTGLPDHFLRGRFHESLIAMGSYNFEFGGTYCKLPFYYYFEVIFAVTFAPFFVAKYPLQNMKQSYQYLRAGIMFLVLFVALHLLFDNKYERYLLPVFPLLLVLLVPMLTYLVQNFRQYRVRLLLLLTINIVLLIPTSFIVAQRTMFDFANYMNQHHWIKRLVVVDQSISPMPHIFMTESNLIVVGITAAEVVAQKLECGDVLVIREDFIEKVDVSSLESIKVFSVGPLESLLIKLNPESNARRRPVYLYSPCATGTGAD